MDVERLRVYVLRRVCRLRFYQRWCLGSRYSIGGGFGAICFTFSEYSVLCWILYRWQLMVGDDIEFPVLGHLLLLSNLA